MSTTDASGTTKYYRSHYNQRCCLHWMQRGATNPWQKTAAAFCLWRADTHFKWFSTLYRVQADFSCCGTSGVDTVLLTYREETKQTLCLIASLSLLEFSPALESWYDIYTGPTSYLRRFPLLILIHHLYLSVARLMSILCTERSLLHIMSRHALTADWLQVCVGTRPDEKWHTPPLK